MFMNKYIVNLPKYVYRKMVNTIDYLDRRLLDIKGSYKKLVIAPSVVGIHNTKLSRNELNDIVRKVYVKNFVNAVEFYKLSQSVYIELSPVLDEDLIESSVVSLITDVGSYYVDDESAVVTDNLDAVTSIFENYPDALGYLFLAVTCNAVHVYLSSNLIKSSFDC